MESNKYKIVKLGDDTMYDYYIDSYDQAIDHFEDPSLHLIEISTPAGESKEVKTHEEFEDFHKTHATREPYEDTMKRLSSEGRKATTTSFYENLEEINNISSRLDNIKMSVKSSLTLVDKAEEKDTDALNHLRQQLDFINEQVVKLQEEL